MVDIVITNLLPHRSLGSGSSPPVFLRNKLGFFGYLFILLSSLVAINLILATKFIENLYLFCNPMGTYRSSERLQFI